MQSLDQLRHFTRHQHPPGYKYWHSSLWLNKAYALTFGYKLIITNGSEYDEWLQQHPRQPSGTWVKLNFMLDILETRPDCEWAALMDSDAFFWMQNQTISLDSFFATTHADNRSFNYEAFMAEKNKCPEQLYPWREHKAFFVFGANGDLEPEKLGYPAPPCKGHYLNAGVMFGKNDERARNFLRRWIYGVNLTTSEEELHRRGLNGSAVITYDENGKVRFDNEQMTLNMLHYPKYQQDINVYPYRYFHWPEGDYIKHYWSPKRRSRYFQENGNNHELRYVGLQY